MSNIMRDYVKKCEKCQRYKVSNTKPAGLLQTPVLQQFFETLAIDLFGPLPETSSGHKWIFIVEDVATKWTELFPLKDATAQECSKVLIEEVFFLFGTPKSLATMVSSIMQQTLHCLGTTQSLIPVYHPEANLVKRNNRELKTQLLVGGEHDSWSTHLPAVRFTLNTTYCQSTGHSAT